MVVGQEKICSLIDKSTLDSFPRSLMIVGPSGGGKHLICDYIADKFQLTQLDITDTLDIETIDKIYERVEPYLYTVRVNEISVKEENTILKFLEEPLKNSYIVLIAETDMGVLPTIVNRCQIWHLQNYTKEYLKTFLKNDNIQILDIATTPGQVMQLSGINFEEMISFADKLITKIAGASLPNTLSVSNKLEFKQASNKYDVHIFTDILLVRLTNLWHTQSDIRYVNAYHRTSELKKHLSIKNLDYKALFEKYLVELRTIMKGA